ncbi:pyridoxamine 5'-phosphate oxidase family protein [Alphaproteobacteria bacterium KMM 3653]|uniref:Pyridoxamine 5'-phosphate oxidase family protein n=1 Tax=Harenicola maris TaxID=2841044 RepID=A0AAP2CMP3_9RHOB|nr:pyridoxamine 5'-phosphate oxidase family protein [Harenicola maris]
MIDQVTKTLIARFPLGMIATASLDGRPRVSPKGTFLVLNDHTIAFGNIRSPQTMANLAANPACETVFANPFTRKGARLEGRARLVPRSVDEFDNLLPRWRAHWGDLSARIKDIAVITVTHSAPVTTPPYDTGATEEEMIATYKTRYEKFYP